MNKEWVHNWINNHCKSKEEIERTKNEGILEASEALSVLDGMEITTEPISFYHEAFKSEFGFAMALSMASEKYKHSTDIIVRYASDRGFSVLKSKSKVFSKYMSESNDVIEFAVGTSKYIESSIKFFNSLGVKGENYEPLSSKEINYAKDMKDALKVLNDKAIWIKIQFNHKYNCPILEWNVCDNNVETKAFDEIKNNLENILKK